MVIVKSIIDHHNGRIDVRSVLGEGTTFTVRLPVLEPVAHALDSEEVSVP